MQLSVVIRTKDEADRLRLTLTALACQVVPAAEIVIVDDGSSDHTASVIAEAAIRLPVRAIHHDHPQGRSAASNAGARAARGDVLLFLDGDTLAHPAMVSHHLKVHDAIDHAIGRGETFHFRSTRFLLDPETASPRAGEEARIARLTEQELDRLRVTRRQIVEDFAALERRAEPGIYPGAGPRRLYEIEMDALNNHADCPVLWAASSGSNMSVRRDVFQSVGGFNEVLDNNEHRELALRLCQQRQRMVPVPGARSYHLTHRVGWRDPLLQADWEEVFYRAHPIPAVKLLAVFWASLSDAKRFSDMPRIRSLPELAAAARGDDDIDYDAIRRRIGGLRDLSPARAVAWAGEDLI
jgi:glycosyltransferase involved in cell wall biosynthesis